MKIILAKNAGFCFGVNSALKTVYGLQNNGKNKVFMLGPIIHNEYVVNDLKEKGIDVISSINEAPENCMVIIRAHGEKPEVYEDLKRRNMEIIDATCPYVKKIHELVRDKYQEGYTVVIAGDKNHPEVKGINGWCHESALIANSPDDIDDFPQISGKCCLVAQTTIIRDRFDCIFNKLKEKCKNIIKFDTICNAADYRQKEAGEIGREADVMLVLGSKTSSNTKKLYEVSKKYCKETYLIETCDDLPQLDVKKVNILGITAGASAPKRIIEEVIEKMEELNKQENEISFEEAFESSMVTLRSGDTVKGRIIGYNNTEVYIDLGYKSDGIIPIDEYTNDPDFKPEENIKIGDEIEVFIVRVNDGEGNVLLSKKKVDSLRNIVHLEKAYENKTPVQGKVVEITSGGLVANVKGVKVFIPASQVSDRYVKDLNEYLWKTITFIIVEFNKQKRRIIGSRRIILAEEKERMEEQLWSGLEVGERIDGTVKSLTDFGAFVDIGGVDGLVHVSELSWTKVKHPSEILKIGDKVQVAVLDFDRDKRRISLGLRKEEDNPWFNASEKYKVGDVIKGTVVRLVPFGAFIELETGLDGLVHISQISSFRLAKPGDALKLGQEVEAKIIEVNIEAKKINLSIKEVNPIDPPSSASHTKPEKDETAVAAQDMEEEVPSGHKEVLHNTIGDMINTSDENK